MGSVINLDRADPNVQFYVCGACQTHIALRQEFDILHMGPNENVFREVVNVLVDDPRGELAFLNMADVHCIKCGKLLGIKYILVPKILGVLQQYWVQLDMTKLQLWNGHQIVDVEQENVQPNPEQEMEADPEQEVQPNIQQEMQPDPEQEMQIDPAQEMHPNIQQKMEADTEEEMHADPEH